MVPTQCTLLTLVIPLTFSLMSPQGSHVWFFCEMSQYWRDCNEMTTCQVACLTDDNHSKCHLVAVK